MILRSVTLMMSITLMASCALPRGAAIQREIVNEKSQESDIAVYQVTKDFLPTFASWPKKRTQTNYGWVPHQHRNATTTIRQNDLIDLVIWDNEDNSLLIPTGQKSVTMDGLRVSNNGSIVIPYLGNVEVAGKSADSARANIQEKLEQIAPSAQAQLKVTAGSRSSVDLVGGVAKPGSYPISDPHFTVLNLVSLGGGVNDLNNPQVQLVRGSNIYRTSYSDLYSKPNLDTVLRSGDKVAVEADKRYFRSLGAASKESIVEFDREKISALDAVSMIGGVSDNRANPKGVLVLRSYPFSAVRADTSGPSKDRTVFAIDLTTSDGLFSAEKFEILSEDTIYVSESPVVAARTVLGLIGSIFGAANTVSSN